MPLRELEKNKKKIAVGQGAASAAREWVGRAKTAFQREEEE
jgi:hypothetical protein